MLKLEKNTYVVAYALANQKFSDERVESTEEWPTKKYARLVVFM